MDQLLSKTKTYLILRGSVIFNNQQTIFDSTDFEDSCAYRNKKFNELLDSILLSEKKNLEYKGKIILCYFSTVDENIIKIELGKSSVFFKDIVTEKGFKETEDKYYPNIDIFIHRKKQKIFMQTNPKLMTEDGLINCLETVFNSYLIDYSYRIHLMAEDNQDKFWSVTSQEYEVKEVEFCLLAPNLFDCNDSASDLSREMHKKMNAERTTIKLVSDTGLILQEDNIGSYVDYTSRGAGYWKIKSFNKRAKSTVKVSSKDARKKMKIVLEYTGGRLESVETNIIKEKFEDENE